MAYRLTRLGFLRKKDYIAFFRNRNIRRVPHGRYVVSRYKKSKSDFVTKLSAIKYYETVKAEFFQSWFCNLNIKII